MPWRRCCPPGPKPAWARPHMRSQRWPTTTAPRWSKWCSTRAAWRSTSAARRFPSPATRQSIACAPPPAPRGAKGWPAPRARAQSSTRAPIPFARNPAEHGWCSAGAAPGMGTLAGHAPLRHIGIYSYRAGFLRQLTQLAPAPTETIEALEQLRALWHGHRIAVHLTAAAAGPGVDTPEDLERVRRLLL